MQKSNVTILLRILILLYFYSFYIPSSACPINNFHIIGHITNMDDGTKLYLKSVKSYDKNIDSTIIKDGTFEFKGKTIKTLEAVITVEGRFSTLCDFYLEPGIINITGNKYKAVARGTKTNEQLLDYDTHIGSLYSDIARSRSSIILAENTSEKDSLTFYLNEKEKELNKNEELFIKKYPDSPIVIRILSMKSTHVSSKELLRLISFLSLNMQQEQEIIQLKNYAYKLSSTEKGTLAPEIETLELSGKKFVLSENRGKYILLDFWASWCSPCRSAFPLLSQIHKKYSNNNFMLVGISLDKNISACQKALNEEKCTWTQLCDDKGDIAKNYAIKTIPTMILISPNGTIIDRLTTSNIESALVKIFTN